MYIIFANTTKRGKNENVFCIITEIASINQLVLKNPYTIKDNKV